MSVEYARPRLVSDVSECFFYHVMDLPGVGVVGGQWDLRDTVDDYLGRLDFRGKRALDVGTASGFLTFEMEKRSAKEVVSFDLGPDVSWDIVPRGGPAAVVGGEESKRRELERLVNAYWFAHRLLGSSARAYHGNVYELPDARSRRTAGTTSDAPSTGRLSTTRSSATESPGIGEPAWMEVSGPASRKSRATCSSSSATSGTRRGERAPARGLN